MYTIIEQFFMKYGWSAAGMTIIALPAFFDSAARRARGDTDVDGAELASDRTGDYVTARSLLVHTADAVERIMSAYKDVTELSGYVARVHEMLATFDDVRAGKFSKKQIAAAAAATAAGPAQGNVPVIAEEGNRISLENVPIVSPNGDVLVKGLTLDISPGTHVVVSGPNGCGKSSLFRMIGGLWPVQGGRIVRPPRREVYFIPQKPYLPLGTLREQVIYPESRQAFARKNLPDSYLDDLMLKVSLGYLVEREGGWDSAADWSSVLSGGEKQRVAFARLLYHGPGWAILDECTSAVSIDVEGHMYQHAKDAGITLLTVTHRPSLWK